MSTGRKILRGFIVFFVIALIMGLTYLLLRVTHLWEKLNSAEKFKEFILSLGFWGRFAFVFLQFLQVTFLPLPSPIFVVAGSLIFGAFQSSLLSLAGILLGSGVAFFIGRVLGKKVVRFMVGRESQEKWTKTLSKYKYSFFLMMLLPLFPDDILCLVAGLTDMSWGFFMTTQFISRPIGIFLVSYLSSGDIIPYYGWGLVVWAVLGVCAIVLLYLTYKYNDKIEKFFFSLFKKKG